MSQENVDAIRRSYEAWNRRDVEGALKLMAPDVEWVLPDSGLNAGTNHGREGFRAFFETYFEAFESIQLEPLRFVVADERVVVLVRMFGAGVESGAQVELRAGHIWTMRDGEATRIELVSGHQETLEAAGLAD
jgi:uncharacterized protein